MGGRWNLNPDDEDLIPCHVEICQGTKWVYIKLFTDQSEVSALPVVRVSKVTLVITFAFDYFDKFELNER